MKNFPLVSIALATYNGEKFLKAQLESIYAQTYKNIEVVVTDDCSDDRTLEILEQYREQHGLKYYQNDTNLGVVKNFERAISFCRGEYIALADQDDIWLDNKIELLVNHIGNSSMIFTDAKLIDEKGNVIQKSFHESTKEYIPTVDAYNYLLHKNFVTGCTVLFDKNIIKGKLSIPEKLFLHDHWLALLATQYNGVKYVKQQLILYRQHENNLVGSNINRKKNPGISFSFIKDKFKDLRNIEANHHEKMQYERLKHIGINHLYKNSDEQIFLKELIDYYEFRFGIKNSFRAALNTNKYIKYDQHLQNTKSYRLLRLLKSLYIYIVNMNKSGRA